MFDRLRRRSGIRLGLVFGALAAALAFPLEGLWPLNGQFYVDWHNHKWLAAFPGEYLRHHGGFPVVINTTELAGMPIELFYGTLFYPLLGLLTAWSSPDLALRIVAVVVMALELWLVSRALIDYDVPPWRARASACLVIWATYPLTNLYHRNAIPEFVGTGLLTCVVALWFSMVRAPTEAARRRRGLALGLVFVLMAGAHPITALFSLPILGLLLVLTLFEHRRERALCASLAKHLLLPAALAVVALGPWLYALAKFRSHLQIAGSLVGVWFYPGIDEWKTRFSFIPFDPRTLTAPLTQVSTPYLDAQLNFALAVLVLGWLAAIVWRRRSVLASLGAVAPHVALAALFTWMSLSPKSYDFLPNGTKVIQIAYRAITYHNLAWLLALFALAGVMRRAAARDPQARRQAPIAVVLAALALSATGVVIKLKHVQATAVVAGEPRWLSGAAERRTWARLPGEFYGIPDYTTPSLFQPLGGDERVGLRPASIPIGTDEVFGVPEPLRLDAGAGGWFTTNVQAFPWNRLVLDGAVVPQAQLRVDDIRLAVRVAAGAHTLELRTVPDTAWVVARLVSFTLLLSWLVWVLVAGARAALAARRVATPVSNSAI
ncbi:MAG: hypothetical protein JWM82_4265 [Myxococcales bacterium]|nr:hypothetical protein [Myxococcales bacterium]